MHDITVKVPEDGVPVAFAVLYLFNVNGVSVCQQCLPTVYVHVLIIFEIGQSLFNLQSPSEIKGCGSDWWLI